MKILVTGAAGFIGYHTCLALQEKGHNIIAIDSFNEYYDVELKNARASKLKVAGINVLKQDITDEVAMSTLFREQKFDQICHLAAQAGVRYSLTHPMEYEHTNVKGTMVVFEAARKTGVRAVVYASSSSVYGGNKKVPFAETDPVEQPLSVYAATKRATELLAYTYHHLYGLKSTGLRFFTVYGPFGRPDMALFKFVKATMSDEPIDVYNNGKMKRDFTYISDIVAGVVAAIEKEHECEIFNLGGDNPVELEYFIQQIEKSLGKTAKKNMMPLQKGDVPVTMADLNKSKELLEYNPQVPIEDGIAKFVEWYKEFYGTKS